MTVTVSGTSITFNDATVQTTAAIAPTTANVLAATAGASAGAVGSYMWGGRGSANSFGTTAAGSQITPAGGGTFCSGTAFVLSGSTQAGTWRCMGYNSGENNRTGTLWLRIS